METQLGAQNVIPKKLVRIMGDEADSFTKALAKMKFGRRKCLILKGLFKLNRKEKNSLKLLLEAFRLNRKLQRLEFRRMEMVKLQVAEAFKACIRTDNVTCIRFDHCKRFSSKALMETMCEGLKERSTPFQLEIYDCYAYFTKPIIEASYLKCFSLSILDFDCSFVKRPMKKLFLKANLYYISLANVRDLEKNDFLQLGRCLLPNLVELYLGGTLVPTSALKRLYGFLKVILDSGRSNAFDHLHLGSTRVGSKLTFAYFRLLRSDIIGKLTLNVKKGVSRAVVKNICSTVVRTKNLKALKTGTRVSSGTGCETVSLQNENEDFYGFFCYKPPFHVFPPDV